MVDGVLGTSGESVQELAASQGRESGNDCAMIQHRLPSLARGSIVLETIPILESATESHVLLVSKSSLDGFMVVCPNCSCVDGGWCAWSTWAICTTTCGQGVQRRSRSCTSPLPLSGGEPCVGDSSEARTCVMAPFCPMGKPTSVYLVVSRTVIVLL